MHEENVGLLLSGLGNLVTQETETAVVFHTFFALVFTNKEFSQVSQIQDPMRNVCGGVVLLIVCIVDHLNKLDIVKCMGSDRMLWELANVSEKMQ